MPILARAGIEGKMFKPMALTVSVAGSLWLYGFLAAKRMVARAAVAAWIPELVRRRAATVGCLGLPTRPAAGPVQRGAGALRGSRVGGPQALAGGLSPAF